MSTQVNQAFVQQFGSNVYYLSQQKGSRLAPFVRNETQVGKTAFYDRIGAVTAQLKQGRHSDTPQLDTPHSRRAVSMSDYEWADLIDDQDKIRMLIDPQGPYAQSAMWAMGRSKDDVIIAAALGTAYSGEDGLTGIPLPASQFIGAVEGGGLSNLKVETLRQIKHKFGVNDVDESIPLHIAVTQSQITSLLGETELSSADFNTVRALVDGKVDSFMGFKFHRLQRLPTNGSGSFVATVDTSDGSVSLSAGNGDNLRRCFAWAEDGLLLSVGKNMKTEIGPRADKSYSTQVYACMSLGAVRMEEEKVVAVLCSES